MKRLVQYLILAAVLVGLPLGCAWIAGDEAALRGAATFPLRTEDWGVAEYWQWRCPFNWTMFAALAVVVVTVVGAFARKAVGSALGSSGQETAPRVAAPLGDCCAVGGYSPFALVSARDARRVGYGFPWWGWLGLVMFAGWLPVVWLRPGWAAKLQVHSFAIMGFGHAFLMDALAYRKLGRSIVEGRVLPCLVLLPASALYWWFFEFLNRFSRNWYFVNLEDFTAFEYIVCFSLGCATILPSVLTTARWLGTFPCFSDRVCEGMWKVDAKAPQVPSAPRKRPGRGRTRRSLLLRGNAAYRLGGLPAVRHRGASGLRMAWMRR